MNTDPTLEPSGGGTARKQGQSGKSAILRVAGCIWIIYGAAILIIGWFQPPALWIVTYGPPAICFLYGAALYSQERHALGLGWLTLVFLVGGGVVTGLIRWAPYGVLVGLQALLAVYTTVRRHSLLHQDTTSAAV